MSVAISEQTVKRRLEMAQADGETLTVRFTAGRAYRYGFAVTGTVDGFVKRPREDEKVRVREAGAALLRTEVPLARVVAIETPVARGERQ